MCEGIGVFSELGPENEVRFKGNVRGQYFAFKAFDSLSAIFAALKARPLLGIRYGAVYVARPFRSTQHFGVHLIVVEGWPVLYTPPVAEIL